MDDLKEILMDKINTTGKFFLGDQSKETFVFIVGDGEKFNFSAIATEKASKFVQEHRVYLSGQRKLISSLNLNKNSPRLFRVFTQQCLV